MPRVEPYYHRCVVPSGPAAGNKNNHAITWADIEYDTTCDVCGEPLVPDLRVIVAHLYHELTS